MNKKIKKIIKTSLVLGLTGIILFIPNPAPVISFGLLGFWSYVLFTEFFNTKKQNKNSECNKEIPYESYKSDRSERSKNAINLETTSFKSINHYKNSHLEK